MVVAVVDVEQDRTVQSEFSNIEPDRVRCWKSIDGLLGMSTGAKTEIDARWLRITVLGHENRKLRSLQHFGQMKAHELRFFIQHGAPFVTKELVPEEFYEILCLASRVAWLATHRRFLKNFQRYFGIDYMKYSVHLMLHVGLALKMFGPLHLVSCYRPENEIGKIARRVCGTYNSTKSIMDTFLTLSECAAIIDEEESQVDDSVLKVSKQILGSSNVKFMKRDREGICRLIGKPRPLTSDSTYATLIKEAEKLGENWDRARILCFDRAKTEIGIFIRTLKHNENCCRNGCLVTDADGKLWEVSGIFAVLDVTCSTLERTFVKGKPCRRVSEEEHGERVVGTFRANCDHIFVMDRNESERSRLLNTSTVRKHLVYLGFPQGETGVVVSVPSNIMLTT